MTCPVCYKPITRLVPMKQPNWHGWAFCFAQHGEHVEAGGHRVLLKDGELRIAGS